MIPQPLRSQRSALPIKLRTHGGPYEIRTHLLSCLPDKWPPQAAPQPK